MSGKERLITATAVPVGPAGPGAGAGTGASVGGVPVGGVPVGGVPVGGELDGGVVVPGGGGEPQLGLPSCKASQCQFK